MLTEAPVPNGRDRLLENQENILKRNAEQIDSGDVSDASSDSSRKDKRIGRRKINIEFIEDRSRRHITFSKRKAGIMKKVVENLLSSVHVAAFNSVR